MKKEAVVVIALVAGLGAGAYFAGNPFHRVSGQEALKAGDYATAIAQFKKEGDPRSLYYLGMLQLQGKGTPKNLPEAVKSLSASAAGGYPEAEFTMGVLYAKGEGVQRDPAQAIQWYRKAAEKGHDRAEFNLAVMYGTGYGVPADKAQADAWLRKSAEHGNAQARRALGMK